MMPSIAEVDRSSTPARGLGDDERDNKKGPRPSSGATTMPTHERSGTLAPGPGLQRLRP